MAWFAAWRSTRVLRVWLASQRLKASVSCSMRKASVASLSGGSHENRTGALKPRSSDGTTAVAGVSTLGRARVKVCSASVSSRVVEGSTSWPVTASNRPTTTGMCKGSGAWPGPRLQDCAKVTVQVLAAGSSAMFEATTSGVPACVYLMAVQQPRPMACEANTREPLSARSQQHTLSSALAAA